MLRRPHTLSVVSLLLLGFALGAPALSLFFWSGDDVFELPMAGLLVDGHLEAWWRRSTSSGHTGLRAAPRLLWALDLAVHGPRAAGYFATNLALHLACMVAVYALAWRWTRSIPGAFAGAAVFGLLGPSAQVITFLSAREDSVVTLLAIVTLLLWPRARGSWGGRFGVAGLYALILMSKESGVVLPGVLLASDLLTMPRREALAPRALLGRYLPLILVLGGAGAAWWQQTGLEGAAVYAQLRGPGPGGGGASIQVLLANLYQGLWSPLADHPGQPLGGRDAALAGALTLLLPAASLAGLVPRSTRRAAALGAAWIALCLLPPAPLLGWGAEQSWGDGRYFHLPSAGLGLMVAAGVAGGTARAMGAATALVGLVAASFATLVSPLWALPADYCRDLVQAIDSAGPGELVIAWPRLDRGAQHVMHGGFLRRLAPSLPDRIRLLVEGEDRLVLVERGDDPWRDATRRSDRPFDLDDLRPGVDVLVAPAVGIDPDRPERPWFEVVSLPLPPRTTASRPDFEWSFVDGDDGWRLGGVGRRRGPTEAPRRGKGGGLALSTSGELDWPDDPEPPDALWTPELVSPPIARPARELCRLELRLRVRGPSDRGGRSLLDPHNFGVLSWTDAEDGRRHDAALTFRVSDVETSQTVIIDLANSPTWRRSGTIQRIGLSPSAIPAWTVLESVALRGCRP